MKSLFFVIVFVPYVVQASEAPAWLNDVTTRLAVVEGILKKETEVRETIQRDVQQLSLTLQQQKAVVEDLKKNTATIQAGITALNNAIQSIIENKVSQADLMNVYQKFVEHRHLSTYGFQGVYGWQLDDRPSTDAFLTSKPRDNSGMPIK